ncbi:unnamed protein product [Diabrotica balteata]|uniref:Uncharacterized protein n=1 Tax=Diabrotica balteata TaxID=107213 RepID=A0A9N9X693_DIABA|nr:unnamed protein product [Diabrotica balteata]
MDSPSKELAVLKKKRKLKKKNSRISVKVKKTLSPSKDELRYKLANKRIFLQQQEQDSKDTKCIDVENDYERNLKKVRCSSFKLNRKPFADIKSPKKSVVKKNTVSKCSQFIKKDDYSDQKHINDFSSLTKNSENTNPVDSQQDVLHQTETQQSRLEDIPSLEENEVHDSLSKTEPLTDCAPEIPIKSNYIKHLQAVHIDEQFSVTQTIASTSKFVKSIQQQLSQIPINQRILPPKSKYIRKLQEKTVREVSQKNIDTAQTTVKEQIQPTKPVLTIPPVSQLMGYRRFFHQQLKVPTVEHFPTAKTSTAASPTKPSNKPKEENIYENISIIEEHHISKINIDMVIKEDENGSGEVVTQKPMDTAQKTRKEQIQPVKPSLTIPPVMQLMGYRRFFQQQKVPTVESSATPKTETAASRTKSLKKPKEERIYENISIIEKHNISKINLDIVIEEDENGSGEAASENDIYQSINEVLSSCDSEPVFTETQLEEGVQLQENINKSNVLAQQAFWKASMHNPMEPIIEETESSPESCTSSSTPPKTIKRDFSQEPSTSGTKKFVEKPCMYYDFKKSGRNKSTGSYPTRRFQSTRLSSSKSNTSVEFDLDQQLEAAVRTMSKLNKAQINATNPYTSKHLKKKYEPPPKLPERIPIVAKPLSSDSNKNSTSSPSYPSSMSSGEYQEMDFDDQPEDSNQNRSQFNFNCYFPYLLLTLGLFGFLVGVYFVGQALSTTRVK